MTDIPITPDTDGDTPREHAQVNNPNDNDPAHVQKSIVDNTNIAGDAWKGDKKYYQSGAKVGQLKPSATMYNVCGAVDPTDRTAGAEMPASPAAPAEKTKAGRPKKIKPAEDATAAVAIANAEMVVTCLDLMCAAISSGECAENKPMREGAVKVWAGYLEEKGMELPSWVQVAVISSMYMSRAFTTRAAKEKVSGLWGRAKAAYRLWRA